MAALGLAASAPALAQTGGVPNNYVGSDGNWHDPSNWSAGRVPGAGDDVFLGPGAIVDIDSVAGPSSVAIRGLYLSGDAFLSAQPGSTLSMMDVRLEDDSTLVLQSTVFQASNAQLLSNSAGPGGSSSSGTSKLWCVWCTTLGNPSLLSFDSLLLDGTGIELDLGGTLPAATGATGPGHYANVVADSISIIDSYLFVDVLYGFLPSLGDSFQIFTASSSLSGTFVGMPEGSQVAQFGSVALEIHYGTNSITLDAVAIPEMGGLGAWVGGLALASVVIVRRRSHLRRLT